MQKVKVLDTVANRYFIGETTSGSTSDIYLTDGTTVVKLEDCLIWDSEAFDDAEFYDIVEHLQANSGVGVDGYEGWTLVKETV